MGLVITVPAAFQQMLKFEQNVVDKPSCVIRKHERRALFHQSICHRRG